MHAILSLMVLSALAAPAKFDVVLVDGSRVSGSLVQWDAQKLVVQTASGPAALDVGKLASLVPQSPPASPAVKPAVWIDLVDGSQLAAADYTVEKGRARIVFSAAETLELPVAEIEAVRLQPASEATTLEWSRIRGRKLHSDVLVKGRRNTSAYEGAVEDVTDQKVRFLLRGEPHAVKRADVFGLIYYHAAARVADGPLSIVDATGSRWAAASLKLNGKEIEFAAPSGRTMRRGLDQIAKIDLSCGKIVYLSDLKPDSETYAPSPFTVTGKELAGLAAFLRPRRDQNLESKSLRIHGQVFHKGLALHSRSELAWTLPGKFSRLEGMAGIDDDVRPLGRVRLQILGDGKTLLETTLTGDDDPKNDPRPIGVDVSSVRRLVLIVDTLGNFGAGDHLDLGNLRLLK